MNRLLRIMRLLKLIATVPPEDPADASDIHCAKVCWCVLSWRLDGWGDGWSVVDFLKQHPAAVRRIKREFGGRS